MLQQGLCRRQTGPPSSKFQGPRSKFAPPWRCIAVPPHSGCRSRLIPTLTLVLVHAGGAESSEPVHPERILQARRTLGQPQRRARRRDALQARTAGCLPPSCGASCARQLFTLPRWLPASSASPGTRHCPAALPPPASACLPPSVPGLRLASVLRPCPAAHCQLPASHHSPLRQGGRGKHGF